jgi:hypothetical protein
MVACFMSIILNGADDGNGENEWNGFVPYGIQSLCKSIKCQLETDNRVDFPLFM